MSTFSTQRRMSVDVHTSHVAVSRPPCSPITNEAPALRKKSSFSLASLIPGVMRPASRATNERDTRGTQSAPATLPSKQPKKPKKPVVDVAAIYGADFARAVAANQFLNGGSIEDSIARVKRDNEKMARRRAEKYGVPYVADATAPVTGPNGELFRDAQEESERRGLVRNAYKGMPEASSSSRTQSRGMREETQAVEDAHNAPWANFRASPAASVDPAAARQRSSTVTGRRDSARADFFANSFAPPMPTSSSRN